MDKIYHHKSQNIRKTWFLFISFLIGVIGVGWLISAIYGNPFILYLAVIFAVVMNLTAYWYSDKLVLKMAKAKPAEKSDYPQVYKITEKLAKKANLPLPKIYIVEEDQPNAFATGRNPKKSVVAVTTGLLKKLNETELEGVIAHELSHIRNRDMTLSTAAVILVGFISLLADFFMRSLFFRALFGRDDNRRDSGVLMLVGIVIAVLAPIGALLMQLAISRKREYLADADGAILSGNPKGLADALKKIASDKTKMKVAMNATSHLWISSPFKDKVANLFMSHPPVEKRIKALLEMEV